ncbi:MAG: bifunctional uridylyltransferase/uridylyl-removing protein [Betaproteobacteria bacterium]|nr:bifunctional uridylyltransferase/uridylyl-removing protein [Betaproteobacteria bacterium]
MASSPQPAPTAAVAVEATGVRFKRRLAEQRAALHERYEHDGSAPKLLHEHRRLVDATLKSIWLHVAMPADGALVAVGGYGRGELFPYSDIDLLILLPRAADEGLTQKLEQFVSLLWDIGLDVGHSVRTVAECVDLAAQDVTIQTSLLEARLVIGERKLFRQFEKEFSRKLDAEQFTKAKRLEQEQRHVRYHDTNLEPNIKESAGGLRDLQTILWISKAAGIGTRWTDLVKREIITRSEAALLRKHENFLQNLRIHLHYLAQRREERLVFDVQTALARQMGLRDTAHRRASEHLMQRFYRTAIEISQLNTIVLQNLGALIMPPRSRAIAEINEHFHSRNELLEANDEALFKREPGAMLEAFVILQQRHELKGITAGTLRALWRASTLINPAFRRDPRNRELFMQILRSPSRVVRELKRMNRYGILGRYIPAFGRVVGQMQHDLYHVYTVDEHILNVVRNLRRFAVPELAHEFPLASRLMSDFERPELLYLAGLFHDIAKGRGGDHSTLGKVDALRFCREHGLPKADADLVAWLVESHLFMSATAQKQDLSDPDVIAAFAGRVGDERHLVALYILTVADIRGTSPKVWNGWKAKLLEDLFLMTRRRLSGETSSLDSSLQQRQDAAKAKLRLYAIKDEVTEKLWSQLDISYFLRHDADEISWHTRLLNYRVDTPEPVVKARLSPAGEGLQVMIYVRDQKDLFARICSFFERISYSIVDAKIYTTRHGYALDSFAILDPANKKPQYRDLIPYIEYELGQRLTEQTPLEPPAQGRVSRQLRHFPITPEVRITADERGLYKVLNIIAGDRPGLLSRVGRCLVDYHINLYTAKINTLGDRAEDVFLINGPALNDPKKVIKFESDLVRELQT